MGIVVVDGVSASGKSMFLKSVQTKLLADRPNFSKLFISEHLTERFFENQNVDRDFVNKHVARVLRAAIELNAFHNESPFRENDKVVSVFIERLFSTLMSRGMMSKAFFMENSCLFDEVKIKNILLIVPPELLCDRLSQSLSYRNSMWSDFIDSIGGVDGAAERFKNQQDKMLKLNDFLSKYIEIVEFEVLDPVMMSKGIVLEDWL